MDHLLLLSILVLPFANGSSLSSLIQGAHDSHGCSPVALARRRVKALSLRRSSSPFKGYLNRDHTPPLFKTRPLAAKTTTTTTRKISKKPRATADATAEAVAVAASAATTAAAPAVVYESDFPQVVDEEVTMAQNNAFPIAGSELIRKAKVFFNQTFKDWGPDTLSEDFVFMGPVVGPLSKEQFITAVTGFDFLTAFPDNNAQYYHFRVDPFEPNRVWTTQRGVATHTGTMAGRIKPTGKRIETPPQALSLKFNEEGQVSQMTVGYVMDRSVGNTGGLGGIFGYLYAIGSPLPFPEGRPWSMSWQYRFFNFLGRLATAVSNFFAKFSKN